jgi:hypothetical protein
MIFLFVIQDPFRQLYSHSRRRFHGKKETGGDPAQGSRESILNIRIPTLVLSMEADQEHTPCRTERSKRSEDMRKTLLVFLAVLFLAPMLSGCFYYPHHHGYGGGYYDGRDRDRDGYRDYRERR